MLQFTVPKANTAERAEFLRQRVSDLQGGDIAMDELARREPFFAGRVVLDSDLQIDLSPLRSLLNQERELADERRRAELRTLEAKALLMAARRARPDIAA